MLSWPTSLYLIRNCYCNPTIIMVEDLDLRSYGFFLFHFWGVFHVKLVHPHLYIFPFFFLILITPKEKMIHFHISITTFPQKGVQHVGLRSLYSLKNPRDIVLLKKSSKLYMSGFPNTLPWLIIPCTFKHPTTNLKSGTNLHRFIMGANTTKQIFLD